MTTPAETKLRDYLKRVTAELTDTRRRLADTEQKLNPEPIAVTGMACRFPGAPDVGAYWELLDSGRSGVSDRVSGGRFDLAPRLADGTVYTERGGFLPDVTGWDADFFGVSPREAMRMDPQQRLLMELTWEVSEDAGLPSSRLAGSQTAVMVGFSDIVQYGQLAVQRQGESVSTDPYLGQGCSPSVASGRIAYHFDLHGPTATVDTACSSALVAIHLAVNALRRGECDFAIAGGGFLALLPEIYVQACATSMLSRQGACRTFDSGSDGYVLGEGAGLVLLTRLSDAQRDDRPVRAVIRGSAVNQDGRSNGLTAPNRAAQVDVIRRALKQAGTAPDDIDYVEAHGSATPLGDQIEIGALGDVFGRRPAGQPLRVGAVKSNLGHTQAAAGIAGLIKTVLVLENRVAPPNLNFSDPVEAVRTNPAVQPAAERTPLASGDEVIRAGVSSFGWSGTNSHVVLESAPAVEPVASTTEPVAELLPVSAFDATALAERLTQLAGSTAGLADLAHTLQTGRTELDFRRAVVVTGAAELAPELAAAAEVPAQRRMRDVPQVAFAGAENEPELVETFRGYGVRPSDVDAAAVDVYVALGDAELPDVGDTPVVSVPTTDRIDVLRACGQLWELGVALDWPALRGRPGRVVSLPTYPFQRRRYWIEPAAQAAQASLVELFAPRWTEVSPAPGGQAGVYLLIDDGEGIATALADRLRRRNAEVQVVAAPWTGERPDRATVVDLSATGDSSAPDAVVATATHLAACAGAATGRTAAVVVTRGGQSVAGEPAAPAQAALAALPVVANQEYLDVAARAIDLDPTQSVEATADALAAELLTPDSPLLVAIRGGRRYVPDHQPIPADESAAPTYAGGTYLITGGLGDIGLTIAGHLVAGGAAGVVLTSRRGGPTDPTDPRQETLAALRATGADVSTPAIDVSDADAMRTLLAGTAITGVVHAAADVSTETFRPLARLDAATADRQFGAKLGGAGVLAEVIASLPSDRAPEWCLAFSSTSALLGGAAFGGYAASNAALSAYAAGQPTSGTRWIAAGWDTWACTLDKVDGPVGAKLAQHAMSDAEALAAFDRLVGESPASAVVAAGAIADRLPRPPADDEGTDELDVEIITTDVRHPRPDLPQPYTPPTTPTQRALADVWTRILGIEPVGVRDNFFDLGGTSLLAPQLFALIRQVVGVALPTVALFEASTVQALAALIDEGEAAAAPVRPAAQTQPRPPALQAVAPGAPTRPAPSSTVDDHDRRVAIVGLAGRFPGAGNVAEFWQNLLGGVESVSFFSPEELLESGLDPELINDPSYVPARPVLDNVADFDAAFFGISPRMAAITDPQQRIFLEVCWEALEQAGYCRPEYRDRVGVFGGTHISTYLLGMRDTDSVNPFELGIGNEKDALTTAVSYLFDLHGPSVAVQTFCSTSLVAAHLAVQSLRAGDCEMALAGGVSIRVPDKVGHVFEVGGMESPDGHVRTFDAKAQGSLFGDGAAVVVLKKLSAAVRDGDHIWGVIRGSAMNNDGSMKVGYTAPSVTGQSRVVTEAMRDAGVTAADIGFVEAHGSGTPMGDPIEVAALTRAFGPTEENQYCALGAVKTNVGHLDRASGATGLIKTALTVSSGQIPPTLHFTEPNPQIDFANSPFFVNAETRPWVEDGRPRVAGLNSLGMGGTNVHMVVEQPPTRPAVVAADPDRERRYQMLPVSARTAEAADSAARQLGEHLAAQPQTRLSDAAYSLQVGRKLLEHRRVVVADEVAGAAASLSGAEGAEPPAGRTDPAQGRGVAFLLAGVGEQYPGLVGELYRREPAFRAELDQCLSVLVEQLPDTDLTVLLTGPRSDAGSGLAALLGRGGDNATDTATEQLQRTEVVQPLMFAVDYALARTLMAWGIEPDVMFGYSLGEYVAASLAGVLSVGDALALVAHRARLISAVERGSMAGIGLPADELTERFDLAGRGLDIASVNGPQAVVAGPVDAVEALLADLREAGVPGRALRTTHAFHSRMLAPLADELTAWVAANVTLNPPTRRYLSNVTGAEADAALVCDPSYWSRHMCQPVQFAGAAERLLAAGDLAVVEIGPGQSLTGLLRGAGADPSRWPLMVATLPAASDPRPADATLTDALARLWLSGVDIDWAAHHGRRPGSTPVYTATEPGRIPLPTYPFQRQRFWAEQAKPGSRSTDAGPAEVASFEDLDRLPRLPEEDWLNVPVWRQIATAPPAAEQPERWLVFARGVEDELVVADLRSSGSPVTVVRPGPEFGTTVDGYAVRPGEYADLLELVRALESPESERLRVVHLWNLTDAGSDDATVRLGLNTLVALARAFGEIGRGGWALDIVTAGTQAVLDGSGLRPAAATAIGAVRVMPLEFPTVSVRLVDVGSATAAAAVTAELRREPAGPVVALRSNRRWLVDYAPIPVTEPAEPILRERGVYLVTGGLGGIGLAMAERLAADCRARLVLMGRRGLPPRADWPAIASGDRAVDGSLRERVARVLEIEAAGGEVEIVAGDVAEPEDVRKAVELAAERFGGLNGVLHAAGVPSTGLIQFKDPGDSAAVLAPKVAGTRAIELALRFGRPDEVALDFLALFSSIASVTGGGPGQVDYAGANAYLDAYAGAQAATGRRVVAVDWAEWAWNAWTDGLSGYDSQLQEFFEQHRARFGIAFDEGWRTLLRAIDSGESRVVVSTQDLPTMVRYSTEFTVAAATASAGTSGERHPRPELVTPYQEPEGDAELRIAEVWSEALRLERIGAIDNFFELGGNSLLGISVLDTLRGSFPGADLAPHVLHEAPTVSALARVVAPDAGGPSDSPAPGGRDENERGQLRRDRLKAMAARRGRN